jgi:cysteine desulfurase/selenocysteine lyase
VHALAEEATEAFESARNKVARFVGADPRGVVFTKNATEAFNLLAYSYARRFLGEGDILLSTEMEHHANLVPWQLVQPDAGFEVRHIPVTGDGELDLDGFEAIVATGRVKLLTVTAMSNVVGTINPVAELADRARAANPDCVVVADGAQSVPHMPTDLEALGADFLCFSGHKMLGPTGIGCLVGRVDLLDRMPPFLGGGEMISNVTLEGTTYNEVPYKFEAGTMNIAQAVGMGAAVEYLEKIGIEDVYKHEIDLTTYALERLDELDAIVYGPKDPAVRAGVVSFNLPDVHPHDISTIVDQEGVAIRAGHHCCQPLMRRLGVPATARASFYLYNTREDVDALIAALEKSKGWFA